MNILANDGISDSGIIALQKFGFNILTTNVAQEQLVEYINHNSIDGLLVRSATTVRKDLIDACPNLKLIGRGGVGMIILMLITHEKKIFMSLIHLQHLQLQLQN